MWATPIRQNHTLDASTYVQSRLYETQFEHRFPGIWTPSPMITNMNVALAYHMKGTDIELDIQHKERFL